jgi:Lrp/AsnC family leucine-responsive transcriptional regulator
MEVLFKNQLHLEEFIDELISYGETKTQIILSDVISDQPLHYCKS